MSQLVGEFVIDVAVLRLIWTDDDDDVTQARVGRQIPMVNRHLGRRDIRVAAVVDPGQILGIAADRFFRQMTDKTMRGPRRDDEGEIGNCKRPLAQSESASAQASKATQSE